MISLVRLSNNLKIPQLLREVTHLSSVRKLIKFLIWLVAVSEIQKGLVLRSKKNLFVELKSVYNHVFLRKKNNYLIND